MSSSASSATQWTTGAGKCPPAGSTISTAVPSSELARQELAQEVGGSSDDWCYVGSFRPGNSIIDAIYHIVLARSVRLDREPCREPSEIIEVHEVSVGKALDMARSGEMGDGFSALALLRCEIYLPGQTVIGGPQAGQDRK